jgi:5-methyltetrahydrofolate--homocysteine methyltransferase
MVFVAKELEKRNIKIPVLIGGATTSKMHTAVKISVEYSSPCIHVVDASRSVTVVSQLLNEKLRDNYLNSIKEEYEQLRIDHNEKVREFKYLSIVEAREKKFKLNTELIEKNHLFWVKNYLMDIH